MSRDKQKPTAWRCKTVKQQKDKAAIYNSREWRELKVRKLQANPLCEQCIADGEAKGIRGGYIRSATEVHHRHPIEDSGSFEEMRHWAFLWDNLMSLCRECHHRIHTEQKSHTREAVRQRREQRQQRWVEAMKGRFITDKDKDNELPTHQESMPTSETANDS